MNIKLQSDFMTLQLRPQDGCWDLMSTSVSGPSLESCSMSVNWREVAAAQARRIDFHDTTLSVERFNHLQLGPGQRAVALHPQTDDAPETTFEWFLLLDRPLLLWRFRIRNYSERPITLERLTFLEVGPAERTGRAAQRPFSRPRRIHNSLDQHGKFVLSASSVELGFYVSGWQSWNFAGVLSSTDVMPRSRLGKLTEPIVHNVGAPCKKSKGAFHSDMFGVIGDRRSRAAFLAGFLSQHQNFGGVDVLLDDVDPYLSLWGQGDGVVLAPGSSFQTDWAALQWVDLDALDPLGPYLQAVALENGARTHTKPPIGWCSWYYFFRSVSQQDVIENLTWAEAHRGTLPLELVQIDDGYQAEVGDWFERNPDTFPDDLRVLSQKIHDAGFQAGIWLAPFILKPGSMLLKEHPDWILRNRKGRPINAGFIWDTFTRALDITHPEVIDFVAELIETAVKTWGFDYLKLDFLYAGALMGERYDRGLTRAQALRRIFGIMREAAGQQTILTGCGCPLGAGVGIFDTMRVGPDVAPHWKPSYRGLDFLLSAEPTLPSTRNAIQSVLSRGFLHKRWWINDGDCLLARERESRLTEAEFQTLATVLSLSGGALILSDHLPELPAARVRWISRLIPPLPREAKVLDWFDDPQPSQLHLRLEGPVGEWHLVALLNWEDRVKDLTFDVGSLRLPVESHYHMLDFWQARYDHMTDGRIVLQGVPAHGVRLLSLRPKATGPQWVGDTLHISQGLAVRRWQTLPGRLKAVLDVDHQVEGQVWLQLPETPRRASWGGSHVAWQKVASDIYRFDLALDREQQLEVSWSQVLS